MKPVDRSGNAPDGGRSLARFIVVGSIGFLVDAGILLVLTDWFGTSPLLARVPSFFVAVICTWLLHRNWTFKGRSKARSPLTEFMTYLSTQLLGIAVNYGVFAGLVLSGPIFSTRPILALALASLSAMALTYTLAHKVVFKSPGGGG